jgi:hypothetical protein
MSKQTDLLTLRAELKRKLADGTYDPLAERISKWLHRILPRLPKGDLSAFLILTTVHVLAAYLLDFSDGVQVFREWVLLAFLTIFFFWVGIFLLTRLHLMLYRILSEYVINSMTQPKDILDLGRWLGRFNSTTWTLFFSCVYLAIIMPYHYPLQISIHGVMGARTTLSLFSGYFLMCVDEYLLITLMLLPLILSRYHIDLYEVDPKMSPSIRYLSTVSRDSAYIFSIYAALGIFFMVYAQIPLFPSSLLYIVPLLCIFIFRQVALTRIVTRARDVALERLRNEIEALDIEQRFDNPALCSQFKAMADYYDSVRNANTGVFDMRAGLLIINSVLLPSTAFIISHFDQIKAFFGW